MGPPESRDVPMKLTTTAQVSVDGVMQGPGGPERGRARRIRARRMGPLRRRSRDGHGRDLPARRRVPVRPADLRDLRRLLGSVADDPGDSPIWTALHTRPKYVASEHTPRPASWSNTTVLAGDVAAAIHELKGTAGRELQVHGSGALFRWLLDNDLVDEMNLFTFPVVVGQGTRLFPDTGRDWASISSTPEPPQAA